MIKNYEIMIFIRTGSLSRTTRQADIKAWSAGAFDALELLWRIFERKILWSLYGIDDRTTCQGENGSGKFVFLKNARGRGFLRWISAIDIVTIKSDTYFVCFIKEKHLCGFRM